LPKYRDFGSPAVSDEPVVFSLYGSEFKCVPAIQGVQLIELIAASDIEDMAKSAQAMLDFFYAVLIPKDVERFKAMTSSDTHIVPMETLAEIMAWLVEAYSGGRPTEESPDSSNGQ
jgi:hypothetical protein